MQYSIKKFIKLIRPHQYVKNIFIFMPAFFSGDLLNIGLFLQILLAFFAFSLSASAVYIFNDYQDIENDRKHPRKKNRPLASGDISIRSALLLMLFLLFFSLTVMFFLSLNSFLFLLSYLLLNLFYSIYLKHIAILDVSSIALGFVLRLFVGAFVADVPLSMWIVIMTFLLALFIALAKRRDDVLLYNDNDIKARKVVDGYNKKFIDSLMLVISPVVIVVYILYITSETIIGRMQNDYIYTTAFFVILGIMRYLQITFVENNTGSPTKIVLGDKMLKIIITLWLFSFFWIIYL